MLDSAFLLEISKNKEIVLFIESRLKDLLDKNEALVESGKIEIESLEEKLQSEVIRNGEVESEISSLKSQIRDVNESKKKCENDIIKLQEDLALKNSLLEENEIVKETLEHNLEAESTAHNETKIELDEERSEKERLFELKQI